MFMMTFPEESGREQSKHRSAFLAECSSDSEMVVLVTPRFPALTLCFVAGGQLMLAPSAFIHLNRPSAELAFAANIDVNVATATAAASAAVVSSRHSRPGLRSFKRAIRPRPRRGYSSAVNRLGSTPATAGEEGDAGEEAAEDDFIPTETLLDDPSHVERIMASMAELIPSVPPLEGVFKAAVGHHSAVRTSNIARAMKFYSLLGMKEVVRFRAESARCAFLEGAGMRLELIEVPASMRPADKALNLADDMISTGLNHIAFDVGPAIEAGGLDGLKGFLSELNRESEDAFGMSVRLVVSPYEQRIGQEVFDLAFVMDADGVLLELLHRKATLDVDMPQAW